MVSVLDHRYQTCTRWVESASTSGFGPSSWTKTTLKVRWEDRGEMFTDLAGNEVKSRSVVYLGEDINTGDYLALGESTASSPVAAPSAYEVKDFRKIPDLHNKFFERRAIL